MKNKIDFKCKKCNYISSKFLGKCPNCKCWNTFLKINNIKKINKDFIIENNKNIPKRINDIKIKDNIRIKVLFEEINRVFGNGIVLGSVILISGNPGIGKTTLLLQLSYQLSIKGEEVIYITGEESIEQIKININRLFFKKNVNFYLYFEVEFDKIIKAIFKTKAKFVIIDSIQSISDFKINNNNINNNNINHLKFIISKIIKIAKEKNITFFIIGHITKDGLIAGPKLLEHMVDTVLYFEGEKKNSFRILRSIKNRFGSINEIGIFDMKSDGLIEIKNPSSFFISKRIEELNGSIIVPIIEGLRSILIEIQALVLYNTDGKIKRTIIGLNFNRLILIIAILEKTLKIFFKRYDIYVKISKNIDIDDSSVDLAIAISIISSYFKKNIKLNSCFIGELDLTGKIRKVNEIEKRIYVLKKNGFDIIYISYDNFLYNKIKENNNIKINYIKTLNDIIEKIFLYKK